MTGAGRGTGKAWLWGGAVSAAVLRLPLIFLPGPGRDEAVYYYWSRHGEPAYAPLLQGLVRAATALPVPEVAAMRLPSLLCGILALALFDRVLHRADWPTWSRGAAVAALALNPWQSYVGAVLHPDAVFLCTLLGAVLAAASRRWIGVAMCLGLAVLAKPAGIVPLVAGSVYLLRYAEVSRGRRALCLGAAWGIAAPSLLFITEPMLQAMATFGRMGSEASLARVIPVILLAFAGAAGLALPRFGVAGLVSPARRNLAWWLGSSIVAAFLLAAIFRGQLKANWFLPGLVLLLPLARPPRSSWLWWANAVFSGLVAGVMTLSLMTGEPLGWLERRLGGAGATYSMHAGSREARVSTSASWSQRAGEYRSLDSFLSAARVIWNAEQPGDPAWIVSDDYGLAAQLSYAWNRSEIRLVLPGDGIYHRSTTRGLGTMRGPVLMMAVHGSLADLPRGAEVKRKLTVTHPVSGGPVQLGVVVWPQ